jgi:cell division protein FtsW
MVVLKKQEKKLDQTLFVLTLIATIFGLIMVFDSSSVTAIRDFADKFYYARQQVIWVIIGFVGLIFASKFDYHKLEKLASPFFLFNILLLIIVLIPGIGVKVMGARRWLNILGVSIQPAELIKLSFIIYLSAFLSKKKPFFHFVGILGLLVALIMLEPDLGTTIVIVTSSLTVFFVSGVNLIYFLCLGGLGLVSGLLLILSSSYRRERLMTFLDMGKDPLGASYHIRQVLLALGAGGLWGLGLGASRQKFSYLPEAMTDSIFAIIAEELGFFGAVAVIILLLSVVWRGFAIARKAPDSFGQYLAIGISSSIGIQILVNIASQVALVPLTGVPLPLISYGGSSLIVVLTSIGMLLNISKQGLSTK